MFIKFIFYFLFQDGAPEGYLSLSFTYSSYLVSLTTQPYYNLIIWNWRTKEKILVQETFIKDPFQIIK